VRDKSSLGQPSTFNVEFASGPAGCAFLFSILNFKNPLSNFSEGVIMFQPNQSTVLQPWVARRGCGLFACLLLFWGSLASAQTRVDSSRVAPDVRTLEFGKPIERELKGAEVHAYQVTLATGQFLHVVVEQRGIDVVVKVLDRTASRFLKLIARMARKGRSRFRL